MSTPYARGLAALVLQLLVLLQTSRLRVLSKRKTLHLRRGPLKSLERRLNLPAWLTTLSAAWRLTCIA